MTACVVFQSKNKSKIPPSQLYINQLPQRPTHPAQTDARQTDRQRQTDGETFLGVIVCCTEECRAELSKSRIY